MSEPENRETVVLKNKYYPTGLNEGTVYDHYMTNKDRILNEIDGKPIILFIAYELNKYVVRRNMNGLKFTLNDKNYEKIISGRTVSIATEQPRTIQTAIIDIDPGPNTVESQIKQCLSDILNSSIINQNLVKDHRIIMSAKSFHLYLILKKKIGIEESRKSLKETLTMEFKDKYLVNSKPQGAQINFDLTPTAYVVPWTLNRNGLVAADVTKTWESNIRKNNIIKR